MCGAKKDTDEPWFIKYLIIMQVPLANNQKKASFKQNFSVWKLPSLLRDQKDYKRLENVTSVASCSVLSRQLRKAVTVFAGWKCLHGWQPWIAGCSLASLWQEVEGGWLFWMLWGCFASQFWRSPRWVAVTSLVKFCMASANGTGLNQFYLVWCC